MKISYNWLQNYFDEKLPEPEIISDGIIFHSFEVDEVEKVGDDIVFDIKILPDRAHDCLSHWGIAKEISAIFDMKIKDKVCKNFKQKETDLDIKIEDDKCIRYMGRIVRNIKVGESPEWLKEKLKIIGQKSINNIVDSANFVMFDIGQPIHCFDLDKLESSKIIIRNGKEGEKTTTLDKKEVNLDETILVIADENNPLAIAGIKGGTKAEVDMNTKNIVIEVANFNHTTTRKTAKKINIQTDAVKRYENEISPELCSITMGEITSMIYDLAGGEIESVIDMYPNKQEQKIIQVSISYINKRLGSNFTKEEIESVWNKLKFIYKEKDGIFEIEVPLLRLDLTGSHDLSEEVIRVLGYDRLEEKLPEINKEQSLNLNNAYLDTLKVREFLLNEGYSEVMTYVFCDKGEVEVLASASDKKFLRDNLSDGLKESIKLNTLNMPLLEMKDIKVFEVGTVFLKDKEEIHVAYGDKKGITELELNKFVKEKVTQDPHFESTNISLLGNFSARPSRTAQVSQNDNPATLLNPKIFKPWSLYPFITRDIAVWVPETVEPKELFKIYKDLGTELLVKDPELVDKFQKQDKISFAYRLVFQSYERTLKDEEVNKIMSNINTKISSLGWEVR